MVAVIFAGIAGLLAAWAKIESAKAVKDTRQLTALKESNETLIKVNEDLRNTCHDLMEDNASLRVAINKMKESFETTEKTLLAEIDRKENVIQETMKKYETLKLRFDALEKKLNQ